MQLAREARDAFWAANPPLHRRAPRPWWRRRWGRFGAMRADGSEYVATMAWTTPRCVIFIARPRRRCWRPGRMLACETPPCLREGACWLNCSRGFPQAQAWVGLQLPRWRAPGANLCRGGGSAGRPPTSGGGRGELHRAGLYPRTGGCRPRRQRQTGAGVSQRGRNHDRCTNAGMAAPDPQALPRRPATGMPRVRG